MTISTPVVPGPEIVSGTAHSIDLTDLPLLDLFTIHSLARLVSTASTAAALDLDLVLPRLVITVPSTACIAHHPGVTTSTTITLLTFILTLTAGVQPSLLAGVVVLLRPTPAQQPEEEPSATAGIQLR